MSGKIRVRSKTMNLKVKMLIFDLDGTLVDSSEDITQSVFLALSEWGIQDAITPEQVRESVGTGVQSLLKAACQKAKVPPEALIERFNAIYTKNLGEHTRLYPGMQNVLRHFQEKIKVVITNKRKRFTDPLMERLNLTSCFQGIYSRESFEKQKPDPLPLLRACQQFRLLPSEVVMIGDTHVDLMAAKAAQTHSVLVSYGYGNSALLKGMTPDFSISQPEELISLFE
jgi:phosphoglycolate phosphatase